MHFPGIAIHLLAIATSLAVPGTATRPLAPRPPAPVRITGIFSNLEYNEEGGDLLGMEVFIVAGPSGWYAVVQCAGGAVGVPVVVKAAVRDTHLAFTLPPDQPECGSRFEGTISAAGLRGRFANENEVRWLPRKKSYWQ